jgi:hypothetical protein
VQPRTAICPTTPELTYQPRWAPRLPHVQWLRSPPDREVSDAATCTIAPDPLGGLRCATCPMAPDPASLRGGLRAPATLAVPCGSWNSKMRKSLSCLPDEDINTSATIIPSVEILDPITRSRAQQLNHQVNSFLCSSAYNIESRLQSNDLIILRNQGEDHGGQTEHQEGVVEPR